MVKFFRTIWLLSVAHVRSSFRNVVWVIVGLIQPICYLLLFAPLLENLTKVPGFPGGNIYNVFTPGLLIMITILGTGLAGFYVIFRLQNGVMERWLVTPMSRFALLLSMVLRDALVLLIQSALLGGSAMLMGFRPDWRGLLLFVPLLALVCIVMSACSYGLALCVRNISALASSVNFFAIPLVLLSGITLPLSLAPETIRAIGKANPFAYAVDAARLMVNGNLGAAEVTQAFLIFSILALLALLWATRSLQKEGV